ncbi:MAG: VWA domain-containing protein [Holophagales bacterium]|nr:VWA domain-containing protein [Holophagales bacterium]
MAHGEARAAVPFIGALEGEWKRNESVSEDPIQKTALLWRDPERTSAVLTGLSASLAERVGQLRLHVIDGQIQVRNARYETLELPTDGSTVTDEYGNRHRAKILPGAIEIETARPGWLLIETFYRQADELHRVVEIQSESFPNLRFLTVYEWDGDGAPRANPVAVAAERLVRPATIRIVPPRRSQQELLRGSIEVETLIVDRSIGSVDFYLDGRRLGRVRKLPFRTRINLAEPPREQILEVRAYSARGAFMGGDSLVLNRIDPPFGIRIGAVTPSEPDGAAVQVLTRVAVPRGAVLERVDFYRNERLASSEDQLPQHGATGGFRTVRGSLPTPDLSPNDYVRVTATLADGRELEDAQLIEGVTFKGEIDVQLIHLQVLVVDADGAPVDGLAAADFRIVEDGERKAVEDVRQAGDVPLILGMAIDSSASMRPMWSQLRSVVGTFLETSLAGEDRAFLVDFDENVRLLQQPTGSLRALRISMDRLVPNGGTALNDGILFSLILYGDEPGRRALVVVTDGVDIDSRSEPGRAAAFAERVGIPLYLIDLGRDRIALPNGNDSDGDEAGAPLVRTARSADHVLRMRQQARQSGGRLFRIDPELPQAEFLDRVQRVFDQIREDLRRQQVLTYYTSRPIGAAIDPDVEVMGRGLAVRSVLPLDRIDADLVGTPAEARDATEYTYTATGTEDDAVLVSVSGLPAKMVAGGTATVTVTVKNAGTTTWTPFGGYGLGSQSPHDNDNWGLRRAPLFGSVAPNETAAFEFPITAPEETGSYRFAWRMVRDPGGWFGSGAVDVPVTVEDPSFGDATIPDQTWVQYEALEPLTFPTASGGDGELTYGLAPPLPPGLSFDLATRVLWGTPATPLPATEYTYTATDADGDVVTLSFSITVKAAVRDDAAVVSVLGLPSKMVAGEAATVTLTVRNTGTTTWTPFGGYGLGSQSPQDNDTWGLRRAPLYGSVAPNETVTFEFPITAPGTPGSYPFEWRMVRDPGGWFGAGTGESTVTVENP